MKIFVGSKNLNKVDAVKEIILDYNFLKGLEVFGKEVSSQVSDQPISIEETIKGAKNRALNSYEDGSYSFGLEDGLMRIEELESKYLNVCVCAIYNGKSFYIGFSSAFENPKEIIDIILNENVDMGEAYKKLGHENLGLREGAIGLLTKGRLNRKEYTKQAIRTALIKLENSF